MNATVVIADDHAILRHGIAEHILPAAGMRAVASVPDAASALIAVAQHKPDILLLDIEMPGRDSFSIISEVRSLSHRTRVVIFSGFCSESLIERALRKRVAAYILKTEPIDVVARVLREVLAGATYFSPGVKEKLVSMHPDPHAPQPDHALNPDRAETRVAALTPRELEVLRYIGRGMDNASMAKVMHLSKRTVERHVSRLMQSMKIHSRAQLVHLALQERLVAVEPDLVPDLVP